MDWCRPHGCRSARRPNWIAGSGPDTEKHSAPCTKTLVRTPGTAEAAAISASVSSRASTTRLAPSRPAAATSALLLTHVCVLK